MTISTRVYADGRTVYIRKDADGNTHELNALETREYLKAKAYKSELIKKAGHGVALAGGIAAGEALLGGAAIAAEAAVMAPAIAIGGTFAAIGLGVWWLIDQAEEPVFEEEDGTATIKVGGASFKIGTPKS